MMLAKLMATLAISISADAMRSRAIRTEALRRKNSRARILISRRRDEVLGRERRAANGDGPSAGAPFGAGRLAAASEEGPHHVARRRLSILRRCGADHLQHLMHRRLILGDGIADRIEQRLHLLEVFGGEPVHGAAERGPVALELLGEIGFPL